MIVFSAIEWSSRQSYEESLNETAWLQEARGQILYYDEVLTNSARMMALTSDNKWSKRYNKSEQKLSEVIRKVAKNIPPDFLEKSLMLTDQANNVLVEIEKESFQLSRKGLNIKAYNLLTSERYTKQKAKYKKGMENLVKEILFLDSVLKKRKARQDTFFSFLRTFVLLAVIGFWVWFYRKEKIKDLKRIKNMKNLLFSTIDNLPALVWAKDRNGKYLFVNRKFAQVAKIKSEDLVGKEDADWAPLHLAEGYKEDDLWVMDNQRNIEREELVPDTQGVEKDHFTVKFPLHDAQDDIIGSGGFSFDVSEIKEKERTLHSTIQALSESEEEVRVRSEQLMKTERMAFVGMHAGEIVHNLKNPLAVIKGYVYLLQKGKQEELAIEKIDSAVDKILDIIKNILNSFSYNIEDKVTEFSVSELIQEELEFLMSLDSRYKNEVKTEVNFHGESYILANKSHFSQIIGNLIKNAIEAMNQSQNKELRIYTGVEKDELCISIEDSGEGISSENLERIFEPLFTTKNGEEGQPLGNGLGLPFCKKMIENYGGKLEVQSERGVGTKFTIRVPRAAEAKKISLAA